MNDKPRYRYEFNNEEGWAKLIDTKTGKTVTEEHHIYVDDVFSLLGISNQLEIVDLSCEEKYEN